MTRSSRSSASAGAATRREPAARAATKKRSPPAPKAPALVARESSTRSLSRAGPVLVDSGPLIALFNRHDRWHAPVLAWLEANPAAALHTTWPVATEVCALLARRLHNDAALDFLRWSQRGGIALQPAAEGSLTEVLRISERFASLPFDLADASLAESASRLRIRHLLSIDADFDAYRDRSGRALVNLLRAT